jgi:hypothetical protein
MRGEFEYKPDRILREEMPELVKPQKSGCSITVRLYFRADGKAQGPSWIDDETGKLIKGDPERNGGILFSEPEHTAAWLGKLVAAGVELAHEKKTEPGL